MDEAEDLLARWHETFQIGDLEPLGIEVDLSETLDDMATTFRGRLDLVADWKGTLVITDWKSNRWMPSSLSNTAQLASYAWLACEHWPEYADSNVLLRQWFVRWGRPLELQISPVGRSNVRETLSRFAREIREADAEREWPACPCEQCSWCGLTCPLSAELIRPPQTDAAAELLAGKATALDSQAGLAKALLRDWVAAHGPVTALGREWHMGQSEKLVAALTAREAVERYGDAAWAALSVDAKKLAKATQDEAAVRTEIGSARFTSHKSDAGGGPDMPPGATRTTTEGSEA